MSLHTNPSNSLLFVRLKMSLIFVPANLKLWNSLTTFNDFKQILSWVNSHRNFHKKGYIHSDIIYRLCNLHETVLWEMRCYFRFSSKYIKRLLLKQYLINKFQDEWTYLTFLSLSSLYLLLEMNKWKPWFSSVKMACLSLCIYCLTLSTLGT